MDAKHFISPSEEVIEEEEKVTFEQLLEPYQSLVWLHKPPKGTTKDDSEVPRIVKGNEPQSHFFFNHPKETRDRRPMGIGGLRTVV